MNTDDADNVETIEHVAILISGLVLQGRIAAASGDYEAETMLALLTNLVKKQEP